MDFPHDGSNDQTFRNSARFHLGTDVDGLPSPLVATFHDLVPQIKMHLCQELEVLGGVEDAEYRSLRASD